MNAQSLPLISATHQQILHFLLMLTLHSLLMVRVEEGLMLFMLLFRNSPLVQGIYTTFDSSIGHQLVA